MPSTRRRPPPGLAQARAGFVIGRDPCAADGRGAEVVLAAHGSDCFRRATIPHLRAVRELFIEALTPEQLTAADDIAVTLRRHLDQSRESARENPAPSAPPP